MKNRPVAVLLLFSLAAAGCQGNPQVRRVVDSYNAEARQMEDMIYLLEQDIQVLEQENSQLKRQIERGGGASGSSRTRGGGLPPRREVNPDDLNPPVVEPPPTEVPESRPRPLNRPVVPAEPDIGPVLDPPAKKPAGGPAGNIKPTGHEQNVPVAAASEPEVADKNVTHIHLSGLHTCGMDLDHQPGDDGLSILIEPRNSGNQFVPVAAPVSVVVLDLSKNGEDARLARWDFTAAEAAEKMTKGDKRGIHLQLPWPAKPPATARLEVFVRYETPEGKKLQGEKEVFIAIPGQFSQRWTPRPTDRQRKGRSEPTVVDGNEPRIAAVPPPLTDIEPSAEKPAAENTPPPLMPPAGLSERQAGEKPAKPKWSPTR